MDGPQSFDDLFFDDDNSNIFSKKKKASILNYTTNSFPEVRRLKGERFEIDESWLKEKEKRRKLKGVTVKKPLTAWPEKRKNFKLSEQPSHSQLKEQIHSMSRERKSVATELQLAQQSLSFQKSNYEKHENQARLKVLKSAKTMVQQMPLDYLYSKPELRHYALEQVYSRFRKFAVLRIHHQIVRAFYLLKFSEKETFDDKQIGFMVISKAFQMMLDRMIGRAFKHWAIFYAKKFGHLRKVVLNEAATEIQRWYRLMRITRTENYQRLWHAVQMCLHRRKAMKFTIRFEVTRRKALIKVAKGIVARRRYHFAARSIQRIYRWICLYRKVHF
jgi:hypothetical protein